MCYPKFVNMVSDIKYALREILKNDKAVSHFSELKSEQQIESMVNSDLIKSVGFSIVPVSYIPSKRAYAGELIMYIMDLSDDNEDCLSSTVDTSLLVLSNVSDKLDCIYGDIDLKTEYIRRDENDAVGVLIKATIRYIDAI